MSLIQEYDQGLLPGLPADPLPAPVHCTRENYRLAVLERHGHQRAWVRNDALGNWSRFHRHKAALLDWLRLYRRDPCIRPTDGGPSRNPQMSLTGLAWLIGGEAYKEHGMHFIDFNDDSQKCFLRRGFLAYLTLLLRDLEAREPLP